MRFATEIRRPFLRYTVRVRYIHYSRSECVEMTDVSREMNEITGRNASSAAVRRTVRALVVFSGQHARGT